MKKQYLIFLLIIGVGLFTARFANGQIIFGSNPDATFVLNKANTYQFNATATPDDEVYTLLVARPGMVINSNTGLISWTPSSIFDGGKVIVQVANTGNTRTDTILFYITEGIQCLPGAVAYWKLDEAEASTGQTTYYDSKSSHNGTEVGSLEDSIGKVNRARKFTGAEGNGISVTDHADFRMAEGESFSVSLWFKLATLDLSYASNNIVLFGKDEGFPGKHWWIGFDKDYLDLTFGVRDASNNFIDAHIAGYHLSAQTWYHLVCQYDASSDQLKIYLNNSQSYDGILNRAFTATDDLMANDNLSIGYLEQTSGWDFPFNGSIDEILFFKKAISTNAIDSLYNAGLNGLPACPNGNSAPIFTSDPLTSVNQGSLYSYKVNASDIDGDALVITDSIPAWLSYNSGSGTLTGTPTNAHVGVHPVTMRVTDGKVTVRQKFNITVVNVNDAPVITSSPVLTVNEEQAYSYQVTATDIDAGDVLTYSLTQKPDWLSVNSSTGLITGTPPLNDTGSYNITVRVTDLASAFDEQTYTLDILNVNDAPVITGQTPDPLTVDEDQQLTITLANIIYTDVDNPSEDITLTVLPGTNYTVSGNIITPALNFNGTLTVNIQLSDLIANTAGTISVSVTPVNDRPVFTSPPVTTATEDVVYIYNITFSDIDGDPVRLSGITLPDWLTLDTISATLTGTPTNDQVGTQATAAFPVKLKVSDGSLDSTQTFVITVTNVNDAPEIAGQKDTLLAQPNGSIALTLGNIDVTDVDDLVSALTLTVLPGTGYTIAGNTVIVANDATTGLLPVNVRVSDPDNAKDEGIYYLRILITSLNEKVDNLISKVYPTPASDYVVFEFATANELNIAIVDITGKLMYEETLSKGEHKVRINTESFNPGIYLFKVVSDNQQHTGRFVISNN